MDRESGNPGVKALVRQKVESAGKIAQYGLVARAARDANCQIADFKRTFPLPHGNQDAHRSFELVLDNMKPFKPEAQNAF
jgi:hypothetical protein